MPANFTAFEGHRLLATGDAVSVALAAKAAFARNGVNVLIFEDETGRQVDFDLRGDDEAVRSRLAPSPSPAPPVRGRPKLGVVAREVTLLPRHWDWLATQPGGASAALRRLVDDARRASSATDERRRSQEAAYRVMSALAGDMPLFEEAARVLFAGDRHGFAKMIATWDEDVRSYVARLAAPALNEPAGR